MKKILLISFLLIFLTGCNFGNTAKTPVEDYLNSYKNLNSEVLLDMEKVIEGEKLSDNQKKVYRDILKKQYQDLKYEIIDENYDGDEAVVRVKITVYDFYKIDKSAAEYLQTNVDKFYDQEGKYDNSLYMDYKLDKMKKTTDKVDYTIEFNVVKENKIWKLNTIEENDLEKIHGIYNYEK